MKSSIPLSYAGWTMNSRPFGDRRHVTLLDDDLAALDHVPRIREQEPALVRLLRIDGHVGIRADAEMPLAATGRARAPDPPT